MRYLTNGTRYARFTDDDFCEVWDDQLGWTFPIPADIAKFSPDWRACDDPRLTIEP